MKLFSSIAAAAVIGASFIAVPPAKAIAYCSPFMLVESLEDMLEGGAPYTVVTDVMNKSDYFHGKGCLYEYKGYAKQRRSSYPKFYDFIQTVNYK